MDWEERLRGLAETQQGLVAKFHLPDLGCTWDHWARARRNGRWEVLSRRVLRMRGSPVSDQQRVLAAVLDVSPGGMLHGRSALAWWGLRGYNLAKVHVARPRWLSGGRAQLATLHELRDIRPHDVAIVQGIPTETALRAIWTEAAPYASRKSTEKVELGIKRIGRLLDQAHRRGLVTWSALHEIVNDIRERGRAGTVIMEALAEARPPGSSPTESRNEDRLERILADAGAVPLRRQVVVGGHEPIGRADFRDRYLPLVVEVNSLTFHTTPSDREADEIRYRRFNDAGLMVAVIWEDDLWTRSLAVARTVADARQQARAGQRAVIHSPSCPWPRNASGRAYLLPTTDTRGQKQIETGVVSR